MRHSTFPAVTHSGHAMKTIDLNGGLNGGLNRGFGTLGPASVKCQ